MKKGIYAFYLVLLVLVLGACGINKIEMQMEDEQMTYKQISQEEAKKLMDSDDGIVILDVRTEAEFEQGHIPGAICVPNETILDKQPDELPNKEQTILVYCRSGNRSKQAAQKLAMMGYTDIREFGGIMDWPYEVTTE